VQRHHIDPKIIDPCCRASTHSHVAAYSHNLTSIKKPTMTPPTTGQHHTLPKNNEKYANQTVSKNFIHKPDNFTKAATTPHAVTPLPETCNEATTCTSKRTSSLIPTPAKDHTSQQNVNNQFLGQPTTDLRRIICHSLPEHPRCIVGTILPINSQNPSSRILPKPQTYLQQHHYLPTLPNLTQPCTIIHQDHKLTKSTPPNICIPTNTLTNHHIKAPTKQATCHPFPLKPPYPQQQFNTATTQPEKMTPILPTLQVESIIVPPQIPENCATKSTQTLMQSLQKQLEITQKLIDHMSRMFPPNSLHISSRIMPKTLFNLIAKLPPNDSITLQALTHQSKITPNHFPVQPT